MSCALFNVQQLRQIEQAVQKTLPPGTLMRRAGESAVKAAIKLLCNKARPILVFAGPGNNGGDALETAVHLARAGYNVHVLHHPPQSALSSDAQNAFNLAKNCSEITWLADTITLKNDYALVIDGLFGIGLSAKKLPTLLQAQIEQINAMTCPVLALDVPSGMDADTGNLITAVAIEASHTITFIGNKPGLYTGDGRDYAGQVEVADLDIDPAFFSDTGMVLNNPDLFLDLLRPRRQNSHKGQNGTVALVGGATGMQGALILASRAALYTGAGKVLAGFIESAPGFDPLQPEIMCHPAREIPFNSDAVVIGPGLGNSIASFDLVSRALSSNAPLVMDADALNLMAQQPALHALCCSRAQFSTLLTPHPLEAARLLGCDANTVQADRINAAKTLASRYAATVILKGSGSIIARPDGNVAINPTGNAGLASGGTGDVLSGVCGSFMAQSKNSWKAALASSYFHGAAADCLVASGIGPAGLCASELAGEIRRLINQTNQTNQAN